MISKLSRFTSKINYNSFSYYSSLAANKCIKEGWVKTLRKMKENLFFDLTDGSCDKKLQILLPSKIKVNDLTSGASVKVTGVINNSPRGDLELHADNLEICGKCDLLDGYPFAPRKSYPPEYVRQFLHLRSRTAKFASLLRVRHTVQQAVSKYLHQNGYIQIHTPILTSNDCEGAGEVFSVTVDNEQMLKTMAKPDVNLKDAYFDHKVFLTVSGQLHLEAIAHGLSKVYTLGPTFRAENSNTKLHLSEFYMLEVEKAFVHSLKDLTALVEDLVQTVTDEVVTECTEDIAQYSGEKLDLSWLKKKFVTMEYEDAVKVVSSNNNKFQVMYKEERGFSKEHELFLVTHNGGAPTFIVNWPKSSKPFYMKECQEDSSKVAAFDLLTPHVGELVGGSLREDNYDKLKKEIPSNLNNLQWYLDLRKYGGVPTGGFGLGFERYLILLLGINNIKDAIPFPRWPHNCNL